MASFCRPDGQCHGEFMPQLDPRQMPGILANMLTSILNAPGQHQSREDWKRKVLIPSGFTVDEIDISVSGKQLKIAGDKDDQSLHVSISIPDDVNAKALTTKWLDAEHSVVIIGPREPQPQVDSDHMKAQLEAWMEDAKDILHKVVSHKEDSDEVNFDPENNRMNARDFACKESKAQFHRVQMEIRGFHPDEISVLTKGNKVTVTGFHVHQSGEDCEEKRMKRTFSFPDEADLTKISWKVDRHSEMFQVFAPLK
ncbi:hypothetical protein CAPTEDRAFT_225631 [Capitella teleta]|uniref:SHSP domain-containing protein n=1 Tax=Capitella teleta TaxID=283909 RepID=R7U647_CAPTE|nr:hypothetical protein CAPTEDRAFT_225631 [Capitella teleta]|eukprot:ELU01424.1 hypothetical protein CAPTEDRAFT_225631 [Capitella teleta]